MQALWWTGVREMRWDQADEPRAYNGEVVVKSVAAGICGSEVSGYLGHNELRTPPLIMGHEFTAKLEQDIAERGLSSGDLVTVNPLVTCGTCPDCQAGQRQYCETRKIIGVDFPGAYGTRLAVPRAQCYRVQDAVAGTLVEPLACAVRATAQSQVELGDAVVVIGAGLIGLMSVYVARLRGARHILLVETNPKRLQHGLDWGADELILAKEDSASAVDRVRKLVPRGVDRVIDAVGYSLTRASALAMTRRGGRVVFLGLHESQTNLNGNAIVRDEVEVVGSFCYSDQEFATAVSLVNDRNRDFTGDWLDVRPASQGAAAFAEQATSSASYAKIVLQLG